MLQIYISVSVLFGVHLMNGRFAASDYHIHACSYYARITLMKGSMEKYNFKIIPFFDSLGCYCFVFNRYNAFFSDVVGC